MRRRLRTLPHAPLIPATNIMARRADLGYEVLAILDVPVPLVWIEKQQRIDRARVNVKFNSKRVQFGDHVLRPRTPVSPSSPPVTSPASMTLPLVVSAAAPTLRAPLPKGPANPTIGLQPRIPSGPRLRVPFVRSMAVFPKHMRMPGVMSTSLMSPPKASKVSAPAEGASGPLLVTLEETTSVPAELSSTNTAVPGPLL